MDNYNENLDIFAYMGALCSPKRSSCFYTLIVSLSSKSYRVLYQMHLLYIQFYELYWGFLIAIIFTQSSLYIISGRAGELLSEIWRIVE